MTIKRMIELLQEYIEDGVDENTQVRLMMQETYPFENGISGLVSSSEIYEDDDEGSTYQPQTGFRPDTECPQAIYICEGGQLGYGTRLAWQVAKQ